MCARKASRPSLYAAIRLATLVQQFRELLKARVKSRAQAIKFHILGNSALTCLQGVVNLEESQRELDKRTENLTQQGCPAEGGEVSTLLKQLDCHATIDGVRLSRVASNDDLLLQHSVHRVVSNSSANRTRHVLDLTTLLLARLQHVTTTKGHISMNYSEVEVIKYDNFAANLEHLLLCLQQAALKSLICHSLALLEAEILHYQDRKEYWQPRKRRDDDWFSEWPSGRRPLSTTWPWNIKPSLVVLWGVCWMFYSFWNSLPAEAWRSSVAPQRSLAQNNEAVVTAAEYNNLTRHSWRSPQSGRVGEAAALSEDFSSFTIGQEAGRTGAKLAHPGKMTQTSTTRAPLTLSLATGILESGRGLTSHPYITSPSSSPLGTLVDSASTWPQHQGFIGTTHNVSHNDWQPRDNQINISTSSQQQSYPALSIIPYAPDYQLLSASTDNSDYWDYPSNLPPRTNLRVPMQNSQDYPSPHSDGSDRASSLCSVMPSNLSPALPKATSPSTDGNLSRRQSNNTTDDAPPRNAQGQITCDHANCALVPKIFVRKCEWTKHMDTHTRPYVCREPGCEKILGFTYSGGLLRHEREVHKQHGGPKAPRMCPHRDCKRSSGTGFSRKENLNEHLRRVHRGVGIDASDVVAEPLGLYAGLHQQRGPLSGPQIQSLAPAAAAAKSGLPAPQTQRKRRRAEAEDEAEGRDDEALEAKVRRLEKELLEKDARLKAMEALVERLLSGQMRGPSSGVRFVGEEVG
ncbi:hypothetical protein MMC11_001306 [Xylographa trunciseda]|nr:hypothetical protein [Xylographa trunciseda]